MTIDTSREAVRYYATIVRGAKDVLGAAEATSDLLEAVARERDEALADIARIQEERAEFVAGVEALAGVLKSERDEALAQVAALRDALTEIERSHIPSVPAACGETDDATWAHMHVGTLRRIARAALTATATATAAAARDAALIERGRREGIEEAALVAHDYPVVCIPETAADVALRDAEIAAAIRALGHPARQGERRCSMT